MYHLLLLFSELTIALTCHYNDLCLFVCFYKQNFRRTWWRSSWHVEKLQETSRNLDAEHNIRKNPGHRWGIVCLPREMTEGIWPWKPDIINADPKGNRYRLPWKKADKQITSTIAFSAYKKSEDWKRSEKRMLLVTFSQLKERILNQGSFWSVLILQIEGKIIRTVKYAEDLVLLAQEETVLQGVTNRLIEVRRNYGIIMNGGKK